MDERDWQIISTLYKLRNITKTANALYVSQPALTARIKQLETELGVKLLYRSNKGVTFTPHGEYTAQFANTLLGEINNFREKLADMGEEVAGILKIASASIIARYYLPALLEGFQQLYPKIKFDIVVKPTSEVLKLVNSHLVDFGFTKYYTGLKEDEYIKLLTYRVLAVHVSPFKIKDLPSMNQVAYPYEEYYHEQILAWWNDNFKTPPKIGSHVSNLDLCKEMVFNGLGYGILPEILIPECPHPLHTEVLHYKHSKEFTRDTYLAFKRDTLSLPLHKLFYEYIQENDFNDFLRSRNK